MLGQYQGLSTNGKLWSVVMPNWANELALQEGAQVSALLQLLATSVAHGPRATFVPPGFKQGRTFQGIESYSSISILLMKNPSSHLKENKAYSVIT